MLIVTDKKHGEFLVFSYKFKQVVKYSSLTMEIERYRLKIMHSGNRMIRLLVYRNVNVTYVRNNFHFYVISYSHLRNRKFWASKNIIVKR